MPQSGPWKPWKHTHCPFIQCPLPLQLGTAHSDSLRSHSTPFQPWLHWHWPRRYTPFPLHNSGQTPAGCYASPFYISLSCLQIFQHVTVLAARHNTYRQKLEKTCKSTTWHWDEVQMPRGSWSINNNNKKNIYHFSNNTIRRQTPRR